ncbi:WbqC family protein [Thiomicrospira microaerophila]|uniref:WbqC family protein n=1 Tax=Thiomicrospira microaerophila TaxID=406020 RepID=UPI0005C97A90|nr:WbqC family protein [Thiomicrospira microaerophila]
MTKVAISQPTYLPWLGYFEQISRADYFVFLDSVQFERRSWQSRNRLKNSSGNDFWLSVPVKKHQQTEIIQNIEIHYDNNKWYLQHLKSIKLNLAKAPFINEVIELLSLVYEKEHTCLADLNIDIIQTVAQRMGIKTQFFRASQLDSQGTRAELLLNLALELNANVYLSNAGSSVYLDESITQFKEQGVDVLYQSWQPAVYAQRYGSFVPNLAWVDPVSYLGFNQQELFNAGSF